MLQNWEWLIYLFIFYNGMLWIYFTFSRLFNNMENNIILSETVLSQTVLNASPSEIMLCWRIYNSNNHFLCSKNAHLCSKPPSILASGASLFLSHSLPLPFLVTGSLQCNYFSPDQSQRQKHFCNFLKSSQRTTFFLIPSILFCCFNQLRTSALFLSSPLPSQKLVFFLAHDRDSMNEWINDQWV